MDNMPQQSAPAAAPSPMHFDAKDIADNKMMAALSYVGLLFLVPLLAKKDSKYAQEHAKQGLVLCIAYVALMVIGVVPILGWLVSFFGSIALLVLDVIGLVKCLQGEFYEIPVIGKFRKDIKI
jgi:uncharacterized membrane protein